MTNLHTVLKSRDITLLTKVCIVKAMLFPVVTYSCESWTVKKEEHQRIDAFQLCCWGRLLKVPWTARRADQLMLTDQPWTLFRRTDAESEAPVLLPCDGKSWLTGKVPDAGKDWGQKEKKGSEDRLAGWHHQCNGHELGTLRELVRDREAWRATVHGSQRVGHGWVTEPNNNAKYVTNSFSYFAVCLLTLFWYLVLFLLCEVFT